MAVTVGLVADATAISAVLDPLRRNLLALLDAPDSATGLAQRLGISRQRVNYHLRTLEDAGLVELVEERPRRGAIERIVRRTADRLVVDPAALAAPPEADRQNRVGASAVIGGAADAIRGVVAAETAADADGKRLAAAAADVTIRVRSPAALHELLTDLAATLARHDAVDAGGLALRVTTLIWPSPPQEESS